MHSAHTGAIARLLRHPRFSFISNVLRVQLLIKPVQFSSERIKAVQSVMLEGVVSVISIAATKASCNMDVHIFKDSAGTVCGSA